MSRHTRFLGKIFNKKHRKLLNVAIDVIEYSGEGIYYVYSPALDLIGYGNSEREARDSWEVVLEEYLDYTTKKNTLVADLVSRGWKVKNDNIEFTPPTFSWMLQNIAELSSVYDKHDFQKRSRSVALPVEAYA